MGVDEDFVFVVLEWVDTAEYGKGCVFFWEEVVVVSGGEGHVSGFICQ